MLPNTEALSQAREGKGIRGVLNGDVSKHSDHLVLYHAKKDGGEQKAAKHSKVYSRTCSGVPALPSWDK